MMRHCQEALGLVLIVLVFGALSDPSTLAQASRNQRKYLVTRVLDARTLEIKGVGTARLLGVAPPHNLPNGDEVWREAGKYCQTNLVGKTVRLETDLQTSNNDGHSLVYLYLRDGTFFNLELVRAGYAIVASDALLHLRKFKAAQEEARQNRRGIWSEGEALKPDPPAGSAAPVPQEGVVAPPPQER